MNRRHFLSASALVTCAPRALWAQEAYPNRAIRLLVPFSAGGSPDLVARLLSVQLGKQLGQSIVVENRLGANGIVAQEATSNATPDGYTLLLNTGSQAINPSIYKKLPFDTFKDFAPVSLITVAPALTLVVNPKFQAKTFKEFLALAKKGDYTISYGSPGTGNTLHLVGEMLNTMAGVQMLHIPYKGAAPALNAVIAGEVTACFLSTTAAVIAVGTGQVRPLAVTSSSRIASFPDVPTIAESGVAGFELNGGWMGIFAPAKTPPSVVQKLSDEIHKAVETPEVKAKLLSWDSPPIGSTPEAFAKFFQSEHEKFANIVKVSNVPMQ